MQDLVIIGAGGFGREIEEYIREINRVEPSFNILGFADDEHSALSNYSIQSQIICKLDELEKYRESKFVIAVGDPISRELISNRIHNFGSSLQSIIHPSAVISPSASIGDGSIICPLVYIGTNSIVGENVAMNVYSSIGHDSIVKDHCVISPYSALTGNVQIGTSTFIGTGTKFSPGVLIGKRSKTSIGTVVTTNVEPGSLVSGNPSRSRVMFPID